LIRVLRGLTEESKAISAEDTAKKIKLSRNLTSGYLNRLADLGYVTKEPNLEGKGARYLFKINYSAIPDHIKEILKKYDR
jgi:predicted transcriptional regulator